VLAGAVKQEKAANPDTVFAAAGDLIGASTFESFIAKDKPTIDALNSAGLEVSAAGNHEFDQGYDDLVNRVMAPYDATTNPYGGANWEYIAANVRKKVDNTHALAPTWTKDFGSVRVGFIGAVTEHLPELVSPSGIADIKVTDIVQEVNAAADDLVADDADVIVLLVHEGAAGTNCDTMDDDPTSDFGSIITGVNDEVDAIVSGHTHLEYNCSFPVAGWAADATHPVKDRPVVSAGQYGAALNKLVFKVDTATGQVLTKTQSVLKLKVGTSGSTFNYPADPATAQIVSAAVENAKVLGAQPLGKIGGPFYRGKLADGTTENRGAESTLGNLVAEAQRWATRNEESGSAQIAFMNPGGLRADMVGDGTGAFPRTLTYKQAADVQSFANTLVNMRLTGAQIKTVLEQQWQPTGASRPFLKLGISKGFTYTFDDTKAVGSRITGMWLNGTPINPTTSYSVTANSFLAGGGDNFLELANGTQKRDTGKVDLSAMVDYMAAFGSGSDVVPVDYKQNGVGVAFPADAPASYHPGDHVTFNVSSWSMTHPSDVKDTAVVVTLGDTPLGSFPLDNTAQSALPGFDTTGKASVDVVLPAGVVGPVTLVLSGAQTGTTVPVTVQVKETSTTTATDASAAYGQPVQVPVTVTGGTTTPTGTVTLLDGLDVVGTGTLGADGKVTITVEAGVLEVGTASLVAVYGGDATHEGSQDAVTVTVTKATASVNAPDVNVTAGSAGTVVVSVTATGVDPTGTVTVLDGAEELGSAEVTDGQATITLPVVADGTTLVAQYEGDEHVTEGSDEFTVHVGKAAAGVTAGDVAVQYGKAATVSVQVTAPAGVQATGTVTVRNGGTVLGSGPVNGGTATVVLPARSLPAGVATLTAEYGGNADLGAGTDSFTVTVAKATSVTEAKVSPKKPKKGKKVKVSVTVTATDGVPTAGGKVTIRVKGKDLTATVGANGKVKVNLGKLKKGSYKVKVVYLGSDNVAGSTDTVKFRVR
jgi:5'-nucleotidase